MKKKLIVLERGENLVVAEHRTALPLMDAVTVESVSFDQPSRVGFRLLRGPVPYVVEEFVLEESEGRTVLTYRGTLGADLWLAGRIWGGRIVKPVWERTVRSSLEQIKTTSEQRASAQARRGRTEDGEP